MSNEEIEAELSAQIGALHKSEGITPEAQQIRAALSVSFDSKLSDTWLGDSLPDCVWDLVDVAAQRGINYGITLRR